MARTLLNRAYRLALPLHRQRRMGNIKLFAHGCDHLGFGSRVRTQAVIDGGSFNLSVTRRGRQQKKCEAVRPSGDGDPDPCSGWNEPV